MSKPMTRSKPAALAVSAIATTPPAGPDRMASLPRKASAAVSPPEDCMNCSGVAAPRSAPTRST
ncbi:hypothetical protein D3C73_984940 [compost metagenome]